MCYRHHGTTVFRVHALNLRWAGRDAEAGPGFAGEVHIRFKSLGGG